MMAHEREEGISMWRRGETVGRHATKQAKRRFGLAPAIGMLTAATALLVLPAAAGPKGAVTVRPLGSAKITIDGSISDWPLDKFTQASEQPPFPEGQTRDATTAGGDHLAFDPKRVGLFNGTPTDGSAFGDFGSSL